MNFKLPAEEYMSSGHLACPGCGASLVMRFALKALGKDTILIVPACCWSIIDGPTPFTSVKVPFLHTAFETAAAAASGVRAALDIKGEKNTNVVAWAGDGGTFDIGFQALSGAVERGENIIYVCYDNEAYMNTGIQRSSATPWGAWTTTTPDLAPKDRAKKNLMEILVAHNISYAATACVAYPDDLIYKMRKTKNFKGAKFIHILSPCPPGWKSNPEYTIKLARLAVHTKVFPLYEVENGDKYTINIEPQDIPVAEYIKYQGRFSHLKEREINIIQLGVNVDWENLLRKAKRIMRRTG